MRSHFPVAVHLFFLRDADEVLLLRRCNTGYEDGNFSVVAGHVDAGETITQAAIREAREEVGVDIVPDALTVVHVMHHKSPDEYVNFFLTVRAWSGEIANQEPEKCAELLWCTVETLPVNTIPYIRRALHNYQNNLLFDEFGW
jgi:8-oxo-dGTP diphosphatase